MIVDYQLKETRGRYQVILHSVCFEHNVVDTFFIAGTRTPLGVVLCAFWPLLWDINVIHETTTVAWYFTWLCIYDMVISLSKVILHNLFLIILDLMIMKSNSAFFYTSRYPGPFSSWSLALRLRCVSSNHARLAVPNKLREFLGVFLRVMNPKKVKGPEKRCQYTQHRLSYQISIYICIIYLFIFSFPRNSYIWFFFLALSCKWKTILRIIL